MLRKPKSPTSNSVKMLSHMVTSLSNLLWPWLPLTAVIAWLTKCHFNRGLNKYPGPRLAAVTDWWRLYTVWTRKAHFRYLQLHEEYGDIVRLGPNTLSFSSPQAIKVIYGMNKKLGKVRSRLPHFLIYPFATCVSKQDGTLNYSVQSDFYPVQMQVSRGEILQSLFGTQDQEYHARLRRAVSNAFSMSSIVQYEARVSETAKVFLDRTEQLYATSSTGPPARCDFKLWLQFFAFDVITEVTYSKRVGFIDECRDVEGIIDWLDRIFQYMAPVAIAIPLN